MTIASTNTPLIQYNGNGATTDFNTVFVFTLQTDLVVTLTSTSGVDTVKTLTTDYTVSGGNGLIGTVSMVVAPAVGEVLTIRRDTPITQNTDYVENDAFPAAVHEATLDKLTLISQELEENLGRAFTVSPTSGVSDLEIPVVPDAFVKWNSDGTALDVQAVVDFDGVAFSGTGILVNDGTATLTGRTLTGTTNEIAVTNGTGVSGNPTLALASSLDLKTHTVTLQDNNLTIVDNADNTKVLALQLSGITTGTTRTLTVPNNSGTIALTSDITGGAPTDASYVALGTNGTLTNERVLTAGAGISLTDAGAGSTITVANTGLEGNVIQVVQGVLTSATSTTSTSMASSGLTASITPASTSNKILVIAYLNATTNSSANAAQFILDRNGTSLSIGDTASSRLRVSAEAVGIGSGGVNTVSIVYLDSPASVSSRTYTVNWRTNGGTAYLNRGNTDTDSSTYGRSASSIVLIEIKG